MGKGLKILIALIFVSANVNAQPLISKDMRRLASLLQMAWDQPHLLEIVARVSGESAVSVKKAQTGFYQWMEAQGSCESWLTLHPLWSNFISELYLPKNQAFRAELFERLESQDAKRLSIDPHAGSGEIRFWSDGKAFRIHSKDQWEGWSSLVSLSNLAEFSNLPEAQDSPSQVRVIVNPSGQTHGNLSHVGGDQTLVLPASAHQWMAQLHDFYNEILRRGLNCDERYLIFYMRSFNELSAWMVSHGKDQPDESQHVRNFLLAHVLPLDKEHFQEHDLANQEALYLLYKTFDRMRGGL